MSLIVAFFMIASGMQESRPARFELEIPSLPGHVFRGDIIELPKESVNPVLIHILDPLASRVSYAKIFPRVNFESAAVISQVRTSSRGKTVVLNLLMRPDIGLRPGANSLEITVFDSNGRRYYRNWILRLKEEARNEWFTYEITRGSEEGSPPEIEIDEPVGPLPASGIQRIRGRVSASTPLRQLMVGGRMVTFPDQEAKADFDLPLQLGRGQRSIVIEAADSAGHQTRVTIPVSGAAEVLTPTHTADRVAVLIGISRYRQGDALACASGAQGAQAEAVASTLRNTGGFSDERVFLLKDSEATLERIRNLIQNAAAIAKPDDLLLIYFGGCGLQDPLQQDRFYLAAYDTQPNILAQTALDLRDLERMLEERVRSKNTLLVFDASASPLFQSDLEGANLVGMSLLTLASKSRGRAVLVAPPAKRSPQLSNTASGQFAEAVKEALAGMADVDGDRLITTRELARYVTQRLRRSQEGNSDVLRKAEEAAVVVALQTH